MTETNVMTIAHVVKTPGVCGGRARIEGTRLTVESIVTDVLGDGLSVQDVLDGYQHPNLTPAKVHAALAYYYDHQAEIDAEIRAVRQMTEEGLATAQANSPERPDRLVLDADYDQWATTKEAAAELGLSDASSIRRLIADGELAAQKFPPDAAYRAVWLIDRRSLAALKDRRAAQRRAGGPGRPPLPPQDE